MNLGIHLDVLIERYFQHWDMKLNECVWDWLLCVSILRNKNAYVTNHRDYKEVSVILGKEKMELTPFNSCFCKNVILFDSLS